MNACTRERPMERASLPAPGELVFTDFRPCRIPAASVERRFGTTDTSTSARRRGSSTLKLIQWNIERGYELNAVIDQLQQLDADIIALQEVDIGCERSGWEDTGRRIADALQMQCVFLCEFEEVHSPLRDARSQGGGVHGNAILSRFEISDTRVVTHRRHPIDWNISHRWGPASKEPRKGERAVMASTVQTPQGPLLVYCVHLEVFCGMLARIGHLADIFGDSRQQIKKVCLIPMDPIRT